VELGYEVVELGPTSNFVGNQMTQGAVDMVQALLQFRRKVPEQSDGTGEGPRLLTGDEEVKAAAALAKRAHTALPVPPSTADPSADHRQLKIVEWQNMPDRALVLLERPYAEDVASTMTLSTKFERSKVSIDFVVASKDGTQELKRYKREIADLAYGLDVDRCRCLMGSGTLEELKASSSVDYANRTVSIGHSDESTVICIVLQKSAQDDDGMHVSPVVVDGQSAGHLDSLRKLIRQRRAANS
jgi:hypothetical protein